MFWIMGADSLGGAALALATGGKPPSEAAPHSLAVALADQLEHVPWEGLHFEDLIFPTFVFIAGVSLVFSLSKAAEKDGAATAFFRLIRRALLLYLLGIFYYGGFHTPISGIRLMGVLQRIALSYGVAGGLFLFFRTRALIGITAGILLGYWALLAFTPVRDIAIDKASVKAMLASHPGATVQELFQATTNYVTGSFAEGKNVVNHFDYQYLPWRKWDGNFDPEGVLSTFPAAATCLIGVLTGIFLRNATLTPAKKAVRLVLTGLALLVLGNVWGQSFPIIKKLWTSSYVLVAAGWSTLALASFYWIIDVQGWKRWCTPFVWVGLNPITVYMAGNLIDFEQIASRFVGGNVKAFLDTSIAPGLGAFVLSVASALLMFAIARFLHQKKIYLRV
jgi:predicted acyltransferase